MTFDEVETKLADVKQRFNAARARKDEVEQEMKDLDAELYRLQGENRVLLGLKEKAVEALPTLEDALKIEAKPKVVK